MKGRLFIITSPSGGGKGTLIKSVFSKIDRLSYSVSYTTREPREGEIDGKDYNFVTREEFEKFIEKDEFLEYAKVHQNFYGTSKTQVHQQTEAGNDIILEIDVQGARNVISNVPEAVGVFILPPSYETLRNRLVERNTESEDDLNLRLRNARKEVKAYANFDFVIINDELEIASRELESIFRSKRVERDGQMDLIRDILSSFEE